MPKHYIAMSGSRGCLPDHFEVYQERQQAVEDLDTLFEFTKVELKTLKEKGYINLPPAYGAEYAEVVACECATPGIHTESGTVDWAEEEEEDGVVD